MTEPNIQMAYEYLSRACWLDEEINTKMQRLQNLRSSADLVTSFFGREKITSSRNDNAVEDHVLRIMEAEEELNRDIDRLISIKVEIGEMISRIREVPLRLVLEKRYLCYLEWSQIAEEMHYSTRWIKCMHKTALEKVQRILEEAA